MDKPVISGLQMTCTFLPQLFFYAKERKCRALKAKGCGTKSISKQLEDGQDSCGGHGAQMIIMRKPPDEDLGDFGCV